MTQTPPNTPENYALIGYREWAIEAFGLVKFPHTKVISELEFTLFTATNDSKQYSLVFVGWSNIVSVEVLNKWNCYCIHPSDLPSYRGGSPIQNQILAGILNTKLTLFRMTDRIDQGPIISKTALSLKGDIKQIFKNLTTATIKLLEEFYLNRENPIYLTGTVQDESKATYFRRREPSMSEITIIELQTMPSDKILNKINCLGDPYPNAYIKTVDGKKLLIKKAEIE